MRIIGLRQYMPEVIAYELGTPPVLTRLEFRAAPRQPEAAPPAAADVAAPKAGAEADSGASARARTTRRGQPVMLLGPDGQPLAPGARWGEPYTAATRLAAPQGRVPLQLRSAFRGVGAALKGSSGTDVVQPALTREAGTG